MKDEQGLVYRMYFLLSIVILNEDILGTKGKMSFGEI
jgi:hypothetical protein